MLTIRFNMQENISRLSKLIARLITNIENEFDDLTISDSKNKIKIQKVITDTLAKLVELVIKLNKLNTDSAEGDDININAEDLQIIENFLQSNVGNMSNYLNDKKS